jgi:ribosomal protection tetracycline resistance protein
VLRAALNLGILAHVDAGKTTLTERLLYAAGVIDQIGSVDAGTTQTDSLELERRRGITIRAAVVSFQVGDVTVNLIDTPGHPDFIAEVERTLGVLDGAVLVISAVEGVQPQTRVLMRALQRLRVPTLLFVNKIDRRGADPDRVLGTIARRLSNAIVPLGTVVRPGSPDARFQPGGPDDPHLRTRLTEVLTARNDVLLKAYVEDQPRVTDDWLRRELAAQTRQALVYPVFFGSAITGAGVEPLRAGLVELLPTDAGDADAPVSGRVLKIERGPGGERIAYVRMFAGTIRARQRLRFGRDQHERVTAIETFDDGGWARRPALGAGEIGKVLGLHGIQVGDPIGAPHGRVEAQFAPPTLETVVTPRRPADKGALRVALTQLAEQDPLINVRQDDSRGEISVSLYGEVQKEVIQATLVNDFGVDVDFHATTVICVERPAGDGEAVERLHGPGNPFLATVGLRIEPGPDGSGVEFRLHVDSRTVPTFIYKNVESFAQAMGQYVRSTLAEGLSGWAVTDCVVTMVACTYSSPDGPPSTRGPLSTAADFRRLTPMVVMRALERAGSVVCEPFVRGRLELPSISVGPVLSALGRLGTTVQTPVPAGEMSTIDITLPAARVPDLQRQLPGLTYGEGVLEPRFGGYQPVRGPRPTRRRTTVNPLQRVAYLADLRRPGAR